MHGHVSGNIVKDIGFRQVVQRCSVADRDRCRKSTIPQAVKKDIRGDITRNGTGDKATQRRKKLIDVVKSRNSIGRQGQIANAFQKFRVRVLFPARINSRVQLTPRFLVFVTVQVVGLMDKCLARRLRGLDKRGLRGRQSSDLSCHRVDSLDERSWSPFTGMVAVEPPNVVDRSHGPTMSRTIPTVQQCRGPFPRSNNVVDRSHGPTIPR
jgi:hypothetical protein